MCRLICVKQVSIRSINPLEVFADGRVRGRKEPMKYIEAPEIDIQVMTSEELFGRKKKNKNKTRLSRNWIPVCYLDIPSR